jgi:hypothetical protein
LATEGRFHAHESLFGAIKEACLAATVRRGSGTDDANSRDNPG